MLGEQHLGDAGAQAAKAGLDVAYGDAVIRPSTAALPADFAGQSFGPGVYNTTAAMGFTAGGMLTLTGDSNAVFIFQIGAALTVGAGAQPASKHRLAVQKMQCGPRRGHDQEVLRPYDGSPPAMPQRLHFTASDEANELIATDPTALLVGFVLDQQVTVQKAFAGPLAIKQRLGALDAATLAAADLEPVFRERPAIHRFPGAMAQRVHDLAVHLLERYDGDAARVWGDAADADELKANLKALPGFGEMKIKALGAVLAKQFGVEAAQDLVPWHPTLGDVDSAQALADYQAAKREHKKEWSKAKV